MFTYKMEVYKAGILQSFTNPFINLRRITSSNLNTFEIYTADASDAGLYEVRVTASLPFGPNSSETLEVAD